MSGTFVRVVYVASVVAAVLGAAACDRSETRAAAPSSPPPRHDAFVRVVEVVPMSSSLDLFAGDLLLFDGLPYKTVTPYRALDGKRYDFALRPAGMAQAKPLSSNTEGLDEGHYYTAVALPGDGHEPHLRVVNDPLDRPSAGKARLRIIHGGVDAGAIDLRAAGTTEPFAGDIAYRSVTDYRDVAPLDGVIEVVSHDRSSAPLSSFRTHIEAGRFYTIVVAGHAAGEPRLEAFLVEDKLSP